MNGAANATSWADMTAHEKMKHRLKAWLNPSVAFVTEAAQEAYSARVRRLTDTICLEKTPDKVPVPFLLSESYPLTRAGMTAYDGMYDFVRGSQAFTQFNIDFQPDAMVNPAIGTVAGRVLDSLDYRLYSWPGRGTPRDGFSQYIEAEWMTAEEYDHLIDDPTDFVLRAYLPRACGALRGLEKLGSMLDVASITSALAFFARCGEPETMDSLQSMVAAGKEANAWRTALVDSQTRLKELGFPLLVNGKAKAPFDLLGDNLRGTKEIALDLYRRPEKVIAACERLAPVMIRWALQGTTPDIPPCLFWPLHKGDDSHMSVDQFKHFYWPSLRTVALALIEEGFIPLFFAEGKMDSRLEMMAAALPKGRTIWLLDRTDVAHAKATLGQVAAIQGNVPVSLLQMGTADEVRDYCRRLIEVAAPGGGFILDSGAVLYHAKDDNLRAMIQAARDYGTY